MQWKKKCKSLKNEAKSSNKAPDDIHNELNYVNTTSFNIDNTNIYSVDSRNSNSVMPLQCHTNEYQVSHSGLSEVGLYSADVASSSALETHSGTSSINFSTR